MNTIDPYNQPFENPCKDFKKITLLLFGRDTLVQFLPDTLPYKTYGKELKGILVGRNWGERLSIQDNRIEKQDTVISIILNTGSEEIVLECKDIDDMISLGQ